MFNFKNIKMKKVSVVFVMLSMFVMAILPSCKEDEPEAAKVYDGFYYVTDYSIQGGEDEETVESIAPSEQTLRLVFAKIGQEYSLTSQKYDKESAEWIDHDDAVIYIGSYDGYKEIRVGAIYYTITSLDENKIEMKMEFSEDKVDKVAVYKAQKK
jgi:hypothetical protein